MIHCQNSPVLVPINVGPEIFGNRSLRNMQLLCVWEWLSGSLMKFISGFLFHGGDLRNVKQSMWNFIWR